MPWCWWDGTGKVIWQRLRILLLGARTMKHTAALFSFNLVEKQNTEALHFIIERTSRALCSGYLGFTWSMEKFMSDGDTVMYMQQSECGLQLCGVCATRSHKEEC